MKLILHIGTEKTGSTSIQNALAACRNSLLERGILYPRLFGSENHMEIAVASMGERPDDTLQIQELTRTGLDIHAYRAAVQQQLQQEILTARPSTILISNEHCHGRLTTLDAVENLSNLLGAPFEQVKIIVYLRRQDRMAVSMHSTRLRGGGKGEVLPLFSSLPLYYNFYELITLYADVFGYESIIPRLYERDIMMGGDVVSDFFYALNLGIDPPAQPQSNISLSRQQMRFLSLFNENFPLISDGGINSDRGPIIDAIHKILPGKPAKPARSEAHKFQKQFDEINRRTRDKFMPALGRPNLFDDNFDDYPEESELEKPLTENELMEFISAIWRYKIKK